MSKEVEEAIKIIQEQKEDAEHGIKYMECTPEDYDEDIYNSYIETKKKAETVLNYIKELEAKIKRYERYLDNKDKKFKEALENEYQERETDYISKQVIRDKKEEITLPNIIVGGIRNRKTLEYGKKLGKIEAYDELLKEE